MQVSNGLSGRAHVHQVSTPAESRGPIAQGAPAAATSAAAVAPPGTSQSQFSNPFAVFGNLFVGVVPAANGNAFANPFGAPLGSPVGNPFGSPFSAPAAGLSANPYANGVTQSAAEGHTVANPTNSLANSPVTANSAQVGATGMGNFGYAQPAFLMAGYLSVGIPVLFAVSFVPFAAPAIVGSPVPAPVTQPENIADVIDGELADDVPANPVPIVQDVVVDPGPVATESEDSSPEPIRVLNNADFERYREELSEQSLETKLVLSLTTAEGDKITLDFRQLDTLQDTQFDGTKQDGTKSVRDKNSSGSDRVVTMDVVGDISAAERSAIDSILESVTQVANQFFSGAYEDAVSALQAMDFDTGSLAELSLSMSMTQKSDSNNGYRDGMEQLDQLQKRGGQVVEVLDFLATEQRRLIEQAKDVLDNGSAAKLVRTLLPPMLEDTVNKLRTEVAVQQDDTSAQGNTLTETEL